MPRRIALVTDSTASLCAGQLEGHEITVVPVQVIIGATSYDDGCATPQMVADALKDFTPVSTSRPNPSTFRTAYEKLAADGADEILSIHLSAELSGTFESAQLAAAEAPVPVTVVDSRQTAFAMGYTVMAALEALEQGGGIAEAVAAAEACSAEALSIFYVDTLEYLRRGGRVSTTQAFLGGALAVKPLLRMVDGKIESFEKVRTAGKALARLEELVVTHADGRPMALTVGHVASPDRARVLAEKLAARLDLVGEPVIAELGAVLGAHVGPGMVAAVIAPAVPRESVDGAGEPVAERAGGGDVAVPSTGD